MKLQAGENVSYLTMLESHRGKIPGKMTLVQEAEESFTGEVAIMGQMLPLENCSIEADVYRAHIEGPHHPFDLEFSVTSEGTLQGIVNAPGHDPMRLTGKIPEEEAQGTAKSSASKTLVLCFSAQGRTKGIAEKLAAKIDADFHEIKPLHPYSEADLKWTNPLARCNREKIGKRDVPTAGAVKNFNEYDTVYIGFPIWYGAAPNVVNSFCQAYDWTGKKVYAFATSGGSGIGKTAEKLMPFMKGAKSVDAKLVHSADEVVEWVK